MPCPGPPDADLGGLCWKCLTTRNSSSAAPGGNEQCNPVPADECPPAVLGLENAGIAGVACAARVITRVIYHCFTTYSKPRLAAPCQSERFERFSKARSIACTILRNRENIGRQRLFRAWPPGRILVPLVGFATYLPRPP